METMQTPQPSTNAGEPNTKPKIKFRLVDLPKIKFDTSNGLETNADEATDEEFKWFLTHYLLLLGPNTDEWGAEDRRDVLNFIVKMHTIHVTGLPFKFELPKKERKTEEETENKISPTEDEEVWTGGEKESDVLCPHRRGCKSWCGVVECAK